MRHLASWVNSLRFAVMATRLCFYQTRSAWSMDQGSNRKDSAVHNFAPTVTKFCDTKFSNCRCEILGRRVIFISSLIPGSSWSGLIKAEPVCVAWATAVSHTTAVPHSSHHQQCLSGYWVATAVFALITPHRTSKDDWRKTQTDDISNFINICCKTQYRF